ncbi:hypothetical protein QN277_022315 [Acacia crassicarpa]|uniref:PGG domain-containing protein n=1 Tax=Acacia crassicarpa TaxID=499986 RepID=A0AAE1JI96_9FABA|nr:hypothetical protein QN277_022315 [Acacia crassicarpa]
MSDQMSDLSVLFRAAVLGDEQALPQWLTTQPADETTQPDTETILGNILRTSALLGHVLFTEFLLNHNQKLALSADSSGRTSLHLTSAEGNLLIVRRLLLLNNELCLARDEEERIPLHYAAMRGRTEVVQELILARPDSVSLGDGEERTVFHLCVIYNHLQTLETLVKLDYASVNIAAGEPRPYIFLRPDRAGDTILHLASKFKRVEVVRYLLSIPEIRGIANFKNNIGFTAHHILQGQSPKDFKICEIYHMLTMVKREENFCKKIFRDWLRHGDEWLEEMRGNLSLVSTVIATITFQALINPPGSFIQQGLSLPSEENTTSSSNQVRNAVTSSSYDLNCTILPDHGTYCPGQAMASYSNFHPHFATYLFHVTISFISSLSVTLLLVSGIFPLKNKAVIWILSMGMCITLTSLAAAFVNAMVIIIPSHLWNDRFLSHLKEVKLNRVWVYLILIIVVLISLRFYVWALKKSRSLWARENGCGRFLSVPLRIISLLVTLFAPLLVVVLVAYFLTLGMY